jgi:hypothetical protein
VQIVDDEQPNPGELAEERAKEASREFRGLVRVLGSEHRQLARGARRQQIADVMEEAGDVLIAFIDAIPQVGDWLLLHEVQHRGRLAVAGRRRDPADAVAQRLVDCFDNARAPDDPLRPNWSFSWSGSGSHAARSSLGRSNVPHALKSE